MNSPISRFFQFLVKAVADNFLLKLVSLALALVLYYSLKPHATSNTGTTKPTDIPNSPLLEPSLSTPTPTISSNHVSSTHE